MAEYINAQMIMNTIMTVMVAILVCKLSLAEWQRDHRQ